MTDNKVKIIISIIGASALIISAIIGAIALLISTNVKPNAQYNTGYEDSYINELENEKLTDSTSNDEDTTTNSDDYTSVIKYDIVEDVNSDILIYNSVNDLNLEFKDKNMLAAMDKFKENKIQITGVITEINSRGIVYLEEFPWVVCSDINSDDVKKLDIGNTITVLAIIDDAYDNGVVYLKNCVLGVSIEQ